KRADALPLLFKPSKRMPAPFPEPDFIFAARDSKSSHRPFETVAVLAEKLGLPINSTYHNEDFARMVREIFENPRYAGKTILICWHHSTIPELTRQLGGANSPDSWKGHVFDRVWQLTYDDKGKVMFLDRPQQLLPKDSNR